MTPSTTLAPLAHNELCINTLRFLAVDMLQQADSGHPGLPMGWASMAYALWENASKRATMWMRSPPHYKPRAKKRAGPH